MKKTSTTYKHSENAMPSRTDWNRITSMTDAQIDYSDIPKTNLANAIVVQPEDLQSVLGPGVKQQITLRIDKDVIEFFRQQGKGYQRLMNFALRAYMLRQKTAQDIASGRLRTKRKPRRG